MDTMVEVGQSLANELRLCIWDHNTVERIWPDVELLLLRDRRWEEYFTLEAFKDMTKGPTTYTWTLHDDGGTVGALITQPEVWPQMTVMRLFWATAIPPYGMRAVREHLEFIELWAKRMGAARIELLGRPAWLNVLHDYEPHSVLLVKDLTEVKEH